MKGSNKFLIFLGVLAVAAVIAAVVGRKQGWFGGEKATKVTAEAVTKRNIIQTVTANGKIYPEKEVKISSDVSGEIVQLFFKEGDGIKNGDLIARIKPDSYNTAVTQVEASYKGALANLESAKASLTQAVAAKDHAQNSYDRLKSSFEKGLIPKVDLDNALNTLNTAKSQVNAAEQNVTSLGHSADAAKASITDARTNLGKTAIYSPITGIVSTMNVEKGEKVVGTLQMTGTEMLRIANFEEMEVRVNVSENDIIRVELNDTAIVEVDAYPDEEFKGIVRSIASSSNGLSGITSGTGQSTNFEVKISILKDSYTNLKEGGKHPFRPGMSATADIQTKRVEDVLSVPLEAVGTRNIFKDSIDMDEELREIVFIEKNGLVTMVEVKTGIQNDNHIEILGGLEDGTNVITAPYNAINEDLEDDDLVEIVSKKDLYAK